jgi:hypothetical protein
MLDAIGSKLAVKKLPPDLDLKKLTPAQVKEKEKEGFDIPQDVKRMTEAMSASANAQDAVSYQTKVEDADKKGVGASAKTDKSAKMQENVAAVQEAEAMMQNGNDTSAKSDKPGKEVGKVKDDTKKDEKPVEEKPVEKEEPQTNKKPEAEKSVFTPKKEEVTLADDKVNTDNDEILKRKARKGLT